MDPDLLNYLSSYDLIFLQETWLFNSLHIPGFTSYPLPAFKIHPKGRPCVGLCCLIWHSLSHLLTLQPTRSPYFQALLLSTIDSQILILNIYIPPPSSKAPPLWDELHHFTSDFLNLNPSVFILFLGDFNTRLGPDNSALVQYMNWDPEDSIPPILQRPRLSQDCSFNPHTSKLVDLLMEFNPVVLSGSSDHDSPSKFTHFSYRGASVLDYTLSSPEALPQILDFYVDLRTESDHLPTITLLSLTLPVESDDSSPIPSLPPPPCRLRWTHNSEESFRAWTRKNDVVDLKQTLSKTNSPHRAVLAYE